MKQEVVLLDIDLLSVIQRRGPWKAIHPSRGKTMRVQVSAMIDAAVKSDPLLHQKLQQSASSIYKKALDKLVNQMRSCDSQIVLIQEMERKTTYPHTAFINLKVKQLEKQTDLFEQTVEKEIPKSAKKAFAEFARMKKSHANYKLSVRAKVGVDATSLFVSAAGAIAAGIGTGFGAIVAVYSMIKTGISLVRELLRASRNADKQWKEVEKSMSVLTKRYKAQQWGVNKTEAAASLANWLTGIDGIKSISATQEQLSIYRSKLDGVDVQSHKLSTCLTTVLDELDTAQSRLKNKAGQRGVLSLEKKIHKVGKNMQGLIDKIVLMQENIAIGKSNAVEKSAELSKFDRKKGLPLKAWETLLSVSDIALSGGVSDWKKPLEASQSLAFEVLCEIDKQAAEKVRAQNLH